MDGRTNAGDERDKSASLHVPKANARWDDLEAFLTIARHGGLSAAARALGSSAPTLGRRMRALERTLGCDLFVRRTHGYDLTDDGARLRDTLRPVESTIIRATVRHAHAALPIVKIAAGTWTMSALARITPIITGAPPDLRVRLLQGEDILSISRREASIGFRSSRPEEAGLAGRRLRTVEFAPYCVSGATTDWIVVRANTPSARWVAERCGERIAAETTAPRLALDLALQGMGRVLLPTFVGDKQGGLERTGPPIDELAHEQWLVTHNDDRALPHVRRALDRIAESFV